MIKIQSLRVNKFRGIKSYEFVLNQRNFVIAGRNGTGKSGVIDALEFAFTGHISRLTGKGTGSVSVKSHGPHVDSAAEPASSWVEVDFVFPGEDTVHTLKRNVASPRRKTLSPETPAAKAAVEWMERHPEFALTRREIVRFVLAEGQSRAEGVAELLGLERIRVARALLQKIANADKKEEERERQSLSTRKLSVERLVPGGSTNDAALLTAANDLRVAIGLAPLSTGSLDQLLDGLDADIPHSSQSANRARWLLQLDDLQLALSDAAAIELHEDFNRLIAHAAEKANDEAFKTAINSDDLLSAALELFDGEHCPVCSTRFSGTDFVEIVSHKKLEAVNARADLKSLASTAAALGGALGALQTAAQLTSLLETELASETESTKPMGNLFRTVSALAAETMSITSVEDLAQVSALKVFDPQQVFTNIQNLRVRVESLPVPSESDKSKADLRALAGAMSELHGQQTKFDKTSCGASQSRIAFETFEQSSRASLLRIYETVQATFAKFYAAINSDDESAFSATLTPTGAGLDMEVAFFDRGQFPPGAYHSEGHQDAMGLCLYLALASHTLGSSFSICALDDVLMSVDSGHRRFVGELLIREFPNTQFVITTHDEQWMRQMKTQGVAHSSEILQFRQWDVDRGPVSWKKFEPWGEVETLAKENQIRAAAVSLRSYLEYFSREAADSLQAPVPFRLDGQNTLGELFDSTVKTFRKTLSKGKAASNSWNNQHEVEMLSAWDGRISSAASAARLEDWAVNTAVHFNEWETFTDREFLPVVAAWKHLVSQFECAACGGLAYISSSNGAAQSLRCACIAISVNLVLKAG
jgi:hypothetical protein